MKPLLVYPMTISDTTSRKLRNLSIICSFFIVAIHSKWPRIGFSGTVLRFLLPGVTSIAVPYFFLCSGFFLAGHVSEKGWWLRELKKRVSSLVVPYLAWAILFLFFSAICEAFRESHSNVEFLRVFFRKLTFDRWLFAIGTNPNGVPQLMTLWFIRCLLMFMIISPIIVFFVRHFCPLVLTVLFVIVLIHSSVTHVHMPNYDARGCWIYFFSLEGLWYFALGITQRLFPIANVNRSFSIVAAALAIVFLPSFIDNFPKINWIVLFSPIILLGFYNAVSNKVWPHWLVSCAFPVYLIHMFFNWVFASVLTRIYGSCFSPPAPVALYFLLVSTCSICTSLAIRRFTPRLGKVLFGGR